MKFKKRTSFLFLCILFFRPVISFSCAMEGPCIFDLGAPTTETTYPEFNYICKNISLGSLAAGGRQEFKIHLQGFCGIRDMNLGAMVSEWSNTEWENISVHGTYSYENGKTTETVYLGDGRSRELIHIRLSCKQNPWVHGVWQGGQTCDLVEFRDNIDNDWVQFPGPYPLSALAMPNHLREGLEYWESTVPTEQMLTDWDPYAGMHGSDKLTVVSPTSYQVFPETAESFALNIESQLVPEELTQIEIKWERRVEAPEWIGDIKVPETMSHVWEPFPGPFSVPYKSLPLTVSIGSSNFANKPGLYQVKVRASQTGWSGWRRFWLGDPEQIDIGNFDQLVKSASETQTFIDTSRFRHSLAIDENNMEERGSRKTAIEKSALSKVSAESKQMSDSGTPLTLPTEKAKVLSSTETSLKSYTIPGHQLTSPVEGRHYQATIKDGENISGAEILFQVRSPQAIEPKFRLIKLGTEDGEDWSGIAIKKGGSSIYQYETTKKLSTGKYKLITTFGVGDNIETSFRVLLAGTGTLARTSDEVSIDLEPVLAAVPDLQLLSPEADRTYKVPAGSLQIKMPLIVVSPYHSNISFALQKQRETGGYDTVTNIHVDTNKLVPKRDGTYAYRTDKLLGPGDYYLEVKAHKVDIQQHANPKPIKRYFKIQANIELDRQVALGEKSETSFKSTVAPALIPLPRGKTYTANSLVTLPVKHMTGQKPVFEFKYFDKDRSIRPISMQTPKGGSGQVITQAKFRFAQPGEYRYRVKIGNKFSPYQEFVVVGPHGGLSPQMDHAAAGKGAAGSAALSKQKIAKAPAKSGSPQTPPRSSGNELRGSDSISPKITKPLQPTKPLLITSPKPFQSFQEPANVTVKTSHDSRFKLIFELRKNKGSFIKKNNGKLKNLSAGNYKVRVRYNTKLINWKEVEFIIRPRLKKQAVPQQSNPQTPPVQQQQTTPQAQPQVEKVPEATTPTPVRRRATTQ